MIYLSKTFFSAERSFVFFWGGYLMIYLPWGGFNLMIYHPSRSAEISVFLNKSYDLPPLGGHNLMTFAIFYIYLLCFLLCVCLYCFMFIFFFFFFFWCLLIVSLFLLLIIIIILLPLLFSSCSLLRLLLLLVLLLPL